MNEKSPGEIILYQSEHDKPALKIRMEGETVWLTQNQIAELFGKSVSTISRHIGNIFEDAELDKNSVIANFAITASDGKTYQADHYNLDIVIAVGYRVRSARGTQFRQWATDRLSEYLKKGFAIDDERLKGTGGGDYWKELLERIRDIRSSEKALYRQVLDLYATSQDYDPGSAESIAFFKTVQNKLHYAASEHTAAELVYTRADSSKDFMGLTTFKGALPTLNEARIAKNYLSREELFRLNHLVSAFFDLAELKAQEHSPMYMRDWLQELDKFASNYGKGVLQNAGTISHENASKKAEKEYRAYQARTLTPVERAYLDSLKAVQKTTEKQIKKTSQGERKP